MGIVASVIIPTYQRPAKAAACVATLARQALPHERYEVLVGLDGPDATTADAVERAWHAAGGRRGHLRVEECPRAGLNATRNTLLDMARGSVLVSLNDDVLACERLLEEHLFAQSRALELGLSGACVSGSAPWVRPDAADETVIDVLVRETSMIFFHDQMNDEVARREASSSALPRDWGFRHCYGLNFSLPMWSVRETGGFVAFPLTYGHDDIELAWRLKQRFGFPVWYRPDARVEHDHRYRAADILAREHNLGVASYRFAQHSPEFGQALFGRDVTGEDELSYSEEFVRRERSLAQRLRETFLQLDGAPSSILGREGGACEDRRAHHGDSSSRGTIVQALYQQHLLLKRWTWRVGLLRAAGRACANTTLDGPAQAAERVSSTSAGGTGAILQVDPTVPRRSCPSATEHTTV